MGLGQKAVGSHSLIFTVFEALRVQIMNFSQVAAQIAKNLANPKVATAADQDAEWQRVNSYIADVLKDSHVLYAKLARLQGDFAGEELSKLIKISESVLMIGQELSGFSKAFYEGKYDMAETGFSYNMGDPGQFPANNPPTPPQAEGSPAPQGKGQSPAQQQDFDKEFDVQVEEVGGEEEEEEKEEDYSAEEQE